MAGAHVQTKDAQVSSGASVDVTLTGVVAGNHLFASSEEFNPAVGSLSLTAPTSSPSATWANIVAATTQTGGILGGGGQGLRGDYSENVASGLWTVTIHGASSQAITGNVSEASGIVTTLSAGVHITGSSGSSSVASQAAGSVTPAAGSIMYAFWVSSSANTAAPSADNSFVLRSDATAYDGSVGERAAQFSKDNVAASAVNVTVSESSGTTAMISAVVEFLASGTNTPISSSDSATVTDTATGIGLASTDTGGVSESAAQSEYAVLRPTADISVGTWTPSSGVSLYAMLNEVPPDDSTYDQSSLAPAGDVMEVLLGPTGLTLDTAYGGKITVRYQGSVQGGRRVDLLFQLVDTATVRASWSFAAIPNGEQIADLIVSQSVIAAISNASDLRLRITATQV